MSITPVFSINDRYTPARDRFESVDAFLAMCRGCFGEAPELHESSPGVWTDVATGERVLEATAKPTDLETLISWLESGSDAVYESAADEGLLQLSDAGVELCEAHGLTVDVDAYGCAYCVEHTVI